MKKYIKHWFIFSALGTASIGHAAVVQEFTEQCEIALALSGAPEHMWEESGVYILRDDGYQYVRESQNGYDCIVERNHGDSVIPQCFDSGSRKANLQVILDEGKLVRSSSSFEEIIARRQEALQSGHYPEPGFGVAYMISPYSYVYNYEQSVMLKVAPHLMFHAPNLSGKDIGEDASAAFSNRGLPIMNAEGPHGLIVSFVESPSNGDAVAQACAGQLQPEDDMVEFPPAL